MGGCWNHLSSSAPPLPQSAMMMLCYVCNAFNGTMKYPVAQRIAATVRPKTGMQTLCYVMLQRFSRGRFLGVADLKPAFVPKFFRDTRPETKK